MTATLVAAANLAVAFVAPPTALADSPRFRPPAVPLVTGDPYFSIWSFGDTLTEKPTTHWTGKPNRLTSLIRIDGHTLRVLGDEPANVAPMTQVNLTVQPTQTIADFQGNGIHLTLRFISPLLPDDLKILARPVTYVTWTARSTDGEPHDTSIYFDAASDLAVNTPDQTVLTARATADSLTVLSVGTDLQPMLEVSGDDRRIDWGHLYVAAPSAQSSSSIIAAADARKRFAAGAPLPGDSISENPVASSDAAVLAVNIPLGKISTEPVSRHLIIAYDDEYSIKYFHEQLKPYWRRDFSSASDLLIAAENDRESLLKRCDSFDAELIGDLKKIGGDSYANIGALSWRQALAAQKVCVDSNGQPLSFSKENFSNGCIATVDVLYPASPQMLIFAPSLLKASLVPLMDYSASPLWKYDAAPHDLGQYPLAIGQTYGSDGSPMPVEESGNMLIMLGALSKVEGNADFASKYWPTIGRWANYLKKNGLDPENQLTTDDFAGHIARNTNLSIKAIEGIAAYGMMADMLGKHAEADGAMKTARDYAQKWIEMAGSGDHFPLVFGDAGHGTWSQKYNLVWDQLLDLNVFPPEVARKEMAFYQTRMNRYGVPLDSRRTYTKLDWECWTATLAEDDRDFRRIVDTLSTWANETPARVPLTDWYETETGKKSGFQARSVVGGVFIGLMRDKSIWKKYASRDTLKPDHWADIPWKMPPTRPLLDAANTAPATWKYTTDAPAGSWTTENFDDANWKTGQSGFGVVNTPGAIVHTKWDTSDIYLRREFTLPDVEIHDPQLLIHHDDDAEVYINGVLVKHETGFVTSYTTQSIGKAARNALRKGRNIVAVHCHQKSGGQYIDVGLVDLLPMPKE